MLESKNLDDETDMKIAQYIDSMGYIYIYKHLSPRNISNLIRLKYPENRPHQFKLFQFFTSPISSMFKKGTRESIHMETYLGIAFWHIFICFTC